MDNLTVKPGFAEIIKKASEWWLIAKFRISCFEGLSPNSLQIDLDSTASKQKSTTVDDDNGNDGNWKNESILSKC